MGSDMTKKKSITQDEPTLFDRAFAKARIVKAGEEQTHADRLAQVEEMVQTLDMELRQHGMCLLHALPDILARGSGWTEVINSGEHAKYVRAFTIAPANIVEVAAAQGDDSLEARWVANVAVPQYAPVVAVYLDKEKTNTWGPAKPENPVLVPRADAIVHGFGLTPEPIEGYAGYDRTLRSKHGMSKIAVSLAAGYAGLKHADRAAFAAFL
jgi:hypothetical protein